MKKILCAAILAALICFPLVVMAAGVELEVKTSEPVAGKDMTVTISVKADSAGWASVLTDFTYDPAVMTLKGDKPYEILLDGALATVNANYKANSCRIVAASSTNIKTAKDIARLTFTVNKEVKPDTKLTIGLTVDKDNALVIGEDDGFSKAPVAEPTVPVPVVVKDKESIRVATPPTKTEYAVGEKFDPAGMVVIYSDGAGKETDVTSAVTLKPGIADELTEADTVITISYTPAIGAALTTTQAITVGQTVNVESVSLDKTALELAVGDTSALTATVLPDNAFDKSVTWSTSDAAVATVSAGAVTGVSEGTATVSVTTVDGGKTASCVVTVTKREDPTDDITLDVNIRAIAVKKSAKLPEIPGMKGVWGVKDETVGQITVSKKGAYSVKTLKEGITTLQFTPSEIIGKATIQNGEKAEVGKTYDVIELRVRKPAELAKKIKLSRKKLKLDTKANNAAHLTVTLKPAGKVLDTEVFWVSADLTVAKVAPDGAVTALKPGKVKITAYSTSMKTATVEVTVTGIVTDIKIVDAAGKKLKKAPVKVGEKLELFVNINDDALDKSVVWTSSNPAVATVDANGVVTAVKKGKATITAVPTDGGKAKATCKITVKN